MDKLIDDEVYAITSVLKTNTIVVTGQAESGNSVQLDVPVIQQAVGANIKVGTEGGLTSSVTFQGPVAVPFAFQAVQLVFDASGQFLTTEALAAGEAAAPSTGSAGCFRQSALPCDTGRVRPSRSVASAPARDHTMPSTARDFNPAQRETLRGHVVNLRQGRFSTDGDLITTPDDVERLFGELLPAALAEAAAAGRPLRVLFFAHGGLVSEGSGVAGALTQIPFWKANGIYPIFFIWETGLLEVLADALRKALTGQRGFGDCRQGSQGQAARKLARAGGLRVWAA